VAIDADPFEHALVAEAPASGESRIRAEVLVGGKPRTVTSHLWLRTADPAPLASPAGGCSCRHGAGSVSAVVPSLLLGLGLLGRRRARAQNR
jgi:hypothetical protein